MTADNLNLLASSCELLVPMEIEKPSTDDSNIIDDFADFNLLVDVISGATPMEVPSETLDHSYCVNDENVVPYEAAPINSFDECEKSENDITPPVSNTDSENDITTPVSNIDSENDITTPVSKIDDEEKQYREPQSDIECRKFLLALCLDSQEDLGLSREEIIRMGIELITVHHVTYEAVQNQSKISKSTLSDHVHGKSKKFIRGRNKKLTDEQEAKLVKKLKKIQDDSLDTKTLRKIIHKVAKTLKLKPIINKSGLVGRKWMKSFLTRYQEELPNLVK